jgi:hypothetical protein
MLIPNTKFLALPFAAVAIIAALAASRVGSAQIEARATVASFTPADCGQRIGLAHCLVTADLQDPVAR